MTTKLHKPATNGRDTNLALVHLVADSRLVFLVQRVVEELTLVRGCLLRVTASVNVILYIHI